MTLTAKVLAGLLIAIIAISMWMLRLDVKSTSSGALVTDRWLGRVYLCDFGVCYQVYPGEIKSN